MLVFNSDPLRLERWAVTDAQGITTTVALEQISFNVDLQRSLFEFRDPRIFKDRLN
jgi:outer membrane lipoprotein-sorting protein